MTVLRLGAGAVAPAPQEFGQQVASLGRTLGRGVASEVDGECRLVGWRQRRVARPRHAECTETIVGRLARLARLRELGEQLAELVRRLAALAGVQPTAGVEEENLRTVPGASRVRDRGARFRQGRDIDATAAVDGELGEKEEPVAGVGRRAAELVGHQTRDPCWPEAAAGREAARERGRVSFGRRVAARRPRE